MGIIYNVYCDESCHLENDHQSIMVLGALWCPLDRVRDIAIRIREIKTHHNMSRDFEIKWTKVSPAKQTFYMDILDYFLDNNDLHFRALIIPDKSKLRHDSYSQTHDIFYYKMFFTLLKVILSPQDCYRIYFDVKDTNSSARMAKLHDVLCNNLYDFDKKIIEILQTVRSHEVEQMQLIDFLVGIVSYANRNLFSSDAKNSLVQRLQQRSGYSLNKTTLLRENKVNIFVWQSLEDEQL
jgi:hypothetical protein